MRHRKATFKIGRSSAHVRALLANAVCSLIEHGRITTTLVKAKGIRQLAEKMMTLAKKKTLHTRRNAIAKLHNVSMVCRLFNELAPNYMNRQGGYTRIIKLGPRIGDAAEMAILEFVEPDAAPVTESSAPAETAETVETAPAATAESTEA